MLLESFASVTKMQFLLFQKFLLLLLERCSPAPRMLSYNALPNSSLGFQLLPLLLKGSNTTSKMECCISATRRFCHYFQEHLPLVLDCSAFDQRKFYYFCFQNTLRFLCFQNTLRLLLQQSSRHILVLGVFGSAFNRFYHCFQNVFYLLLEDLTSASVSIRFYLSVSKSSYLYFQRVLTLHLESFCYI